MRAKNVFRGPKQAQGEALLGAGKAQATKSGRNRVTRAKSARKAGKKRSKAREMPQVGEKRSEEGAKTAKSGENPSMQPQIDEKHRNIGGRDATDAGSLSYGHGALGRELLDRLEAKS